MTEAEWLASDDPAAMLEYLRGRGMDIVERKPSDRKLRLLAQHLMGPIYGAAPTGEGYPSLPYDWLTGWFSAGAHGGDPSGKDRAAQATLLRDIFGNPFRPIYFADGTKPAGLTLAMRGAPYWLLSCRLRDWNDRAIPRLAQTIYDERRFEDMPILADCLEEAGCTNEAIIRHCNGWDRPCEKCERREPFPHHPECNSYGVLRPLHVRGCWVLDLLLGKS